MSAWFNRASSTFAGMIGALAVLAVPTYLWLTRELDYLRSNLDDNSNALKGIETASVNILDGVNSAVSNSEGAVLQADAANIKAAYLAASMPENVLLVDEFLSDSMPRSEYENLVDTGKLGLLKAAKVDGKELVFLDSTNLSRFSAEERDVLVGLEKFGGPKLIVWDPSLFPGYSLKQ